MEDDELTLRIREAIQLEVERYLSFKYVDVYFSFRDEMRLALLRKKLGWEAFSYYNGEGGVWGEEK